MKEIIIVNESRRKFLKTSTGLGLAVYLQQAHMAKGSDIVNSTTRPTVLNKLTPDAFVRLNADNTVTVIVKHLEMGQGTHTGLPTLVAEELDAAWSQIRVEGAVADANRYNNLFWGTVQGTGASNSLANSFMQLRLVGATARAMLIAAAATEWGVPAADIRIKNGIVSHAASNHQATFGELAASAARQEIPKNPPLKHPKDFVYIGKTFARTDSHSKVNGSAQYTADIRLPGMLIALVAHAPLFGATLKSFDATQAKMISGVVDIVAIPTGVAVLANDFWAASKGRSALKIEWDESKAFKLNSTEMFTHYEALAQSPGLVAKKFGDAETIMDSAVKRLEAVFKFPYLAHAAMEPMNCVMKLDGDHCEVWNGEQLQTIDQNNIAKALGLKPENVKLNMLYAGGSFGRRANPRSDYLLEAAQVIKATHGRTPIKLLWTREDDMQAGEYRPMFYHTMSAGLNAHGEIIAWQHRLVGQSIIAGTTFESSLVKNGVDVTSVEGAINLPYSIPNLLVDLHTTNWPVPVLWWRAVGSSHTAFSTEVFFDEVAHAAGKDTVAFRRALLQKHPRHLATLELAAKKSDWSKPLPVKRGVRRGRGIALHESFNTVVAQVAEVSVKPDGSFKVDRVVCAVDCGMAVNPSIVRAQMEGGIGFGLCAALYGAITLKEGRIEQSNFHDYRVLRMNEMPQVDVYIVPSTANPSGVGEPSLPPLAPAVANALFAATGKRLRQLPFQTKDLV